MNKAKYLNDVLTSMEAEDIISKQLKFGMLEDYASESFLRQHAILEKLNMQALKNALLGGEDFILETFVTYEMMKPLIGELFICNQFRTYIYPRIKSEVIKRSSLKAYICLYHEAVVVNLLENFFFHVTACQASEDLIIDVIEYCYSKISKLLNVKRKYGNFSDEEKLNLKSEEDFDCKIEEIEFSIAVTSLSILRYFTDHLTQLPFPVRNHLLNVKDIPLILVPLMEMKPWIRERKFRDNKKFTEIFENNQWNKITDDNVMAKISKIEAQIWLSIFNILMNSDNNKKYEITEFRKNNLIRLRKFMNEILYDQIPPLQHLYRALEEISLMEFSAVPTSNPFIVEMIPSLFNKKLNNEEIDRISKIILGYFPSDPSKYKKEMEIISEVYSWNNLEYFMEDPKCASCGKDAASRCSKCKSEWYCGRECQIKRWKQHKEFCGKLAELNQVLDQEKDHSFNTSMNQVAVTNSNIREVKHKEIKKETSSKDVDTKIKEAYIEEEKIKYQNIQNPDNMKVQKEIVNEFEVLD